MSTYNDLFFVCAFSFFFFKFCSWVQSILNTSESPCGGESNTLTEELCVCESPKNVFHFVVPLGSLLCLHSVELFSLFLGFSFFFLFPLNCPGDITSSQRIGFVEPPLKS